MPKGSQESTTDKTTTMTFRTSPEVKSEVESLAEKISGLKWKFHWSSPIRKCKSKSGLIHELCAGTLSIPEIKQKIQEVENE